MQSTRIARKLDCRGIHVRSEHSLLRARHCANAQGREVTLLDYGAGNVRSVRNALAKLGCTVKEVECAADIANAGRLLFPGVGSYGQAMAELGRKGYVDALREYVEADKPFLGICLGLQLLFDGGDENGGVEGLGVIPGRVGSFDAARGRPVPHIGWNTIQPLRPSRLLAQTDAEERLYFVHSYRAVPGAGNADWALATAAYGEEFLAAVAKGNVHACQFHPEKSGAAGQRILRSFLDLERLEEPKDVARPRAGFTPGLARRVIACLDVRANDDGDLVVTKGDQYDVREASATSRGVHSSSGNGNGAARAVRNLGKPVALAADYYEGGADEVTFLNITGFRDFPLGDLPMMEVLRQASEGVFVPLTVGGGIRDFTDSTGTRYSALEVASAYFRSGADKVSIGSDAVEVAMAYRASGVKSGTSAIEQISEHYGKQAVVISIDPRRAWVLDDDVAACPHALVESAKQGPAGERHCWWQCTVKGGREARDIGAVELAQACEELGAGEILLNCIDCDGAGQGFDLELVDAVVEAVSIPVIASSGAGTPSHFADCFQATGASAALAAGIFHRREVSIAEVKAHMAEAGLPTRISHVLVS